MPILKVFALTALLTLTGILAVSGESLTSQIPWRPVWEQHEVQESPRVIQVITQGHFVYPWALRRAGVEGTVVLLLTLGPGGQVLGEKVERSSGQVLLDQAALQGAAQFVYSADPSQPLRQTSLEVNFFLKNPQKLK